MPRLVTVVLSLGLAAAACTSDRESFPPRTAMEQLLISGAVDDALRRLKLDIPAGTKIWVDAGNFDGYDQKYAVGAIRDRLLWLGAQIVADRGSAETVVEIRSGALSIEDTDSLLGIPGAQVPIPLAGSLSTPQIPLFKSGRATGVAKIGLTAYNAKTGALEPFSPSVPVYGFAHRAHWRLAVRRLVGIGRAAAGYGREIAPPRACCSATLR